MSNQSNGSQVREPALHSVSKAVRKDVKLGMVSITAYMLPDGAYTLASSSITKAIHKRRFSLSEFLASKSVESLSCLGFSLSEMTEFPTTDSGAGIKPVPLHVAISYWNYWNRKGNRYAITLIEALANGHMMTLLDDAFGIQRDEKEREEALAAMLHPGTSIKIQQVRADLEARLEEVEAKFTGELWLKVAQIEQLNKINQGLTEQKEELEGEIFVQKERNKEKERGLDTWYEKARWAVNMKQLGDRKIHLLSQQVEQLKKELKEERNAAKAEIDRCYQTIIRNSQAMAEQILADKQRQASKHDDLF